MEGKWNESTPMQSILCKFQSINQQFERMKCNDKTKIDDYILIVDGLKSIIDLLENPQDDRQKSSLKAQTCSRIGSIYYHLIQNSGKAKIYFDMCIELGAQSAWFESWYVEAVQLSQKIQSDAQRNRSDWQTFENNLPKQTTSGVNSHNQSDWKAFEKDLPRHDTASVNSHNPMDDGSDQSQTPTTAEIKLSSIIKKLQAADKQLDKLRSNSNYQTDQVLILIDTYKQILPIAMDDEIHDSSVIAKTNSRIGLLFYQFLKKPEKAKVYFTRCKIVHQANNDGNSNEEDWYQEANTMLNLIQQEDHPKPTEGQRPTNDSSPWRQHFPDSFENDKTNGSYSTFMDHVSHDTKTVFTDEDLFSSCNGDDSPIEVMLDSTNKEYNCIIKSMNHNNNTTTLKLIQTYQQLIPRFHPSQYQIVAEIQSKLGNIYYKIIRNLNKAREFYVKCIQLMDTHSNKDENSASDWLIAARQSLDQINKLKAASDRCNVNAFQYDNSMSNDFGQSTSGSNNQWSFNSGYTIFDSYWTPQNVFIAKLKLDVAEEKLKRSLHSNSTNSDLLTQLKKTFQEIIQSAIFNEENLKARAYYNIALMQYHLDVDKNAARTGLEACIREAGSSCTTEQWYQDAHQLLKTIIRGDNTASTSSKQSTTTERTDIDPSSFSYDNHIRLQIAKQRFHTSDQKLNTLQEANDSCDRDFEALILIDSYKEIIFLLNKNHLDLIAQANCRIGKIYYYIVRNNDKAIHYCQHCIDMASKESRLESWCRAAFDIIQKISKETEENINKQEEDNFDINTELIQEEENLRQSCNSIEKLLRFIYQKYPLPQYREKSYQLPKVITISQEKRLLNKALVHYHPDRNSRREYGLRWYKRCEMITRCINECKKKAAIANWATFENV
ncbi:uncharacterized protein TRIADDRAFT_58179 [Trichoplax adhaerens]|uniref:Uncharacterized protein n=1 Tax=Trichoplax adhaerens TaxID=10228 RepID=B3S133_TRIAD|nr:predicted protein [Trichoplax adhaerens]EDV23168.1 predicted protein [Trichoplax adhaerens]|eukprot:XP_002114078.1 predicted protein [Trichoplax adhaerens]